MNVTQVTRNATLDDLSAQDYRDIYDELRRYDEQSGKFIVSLDYGSKWFIAEAMERRETFTGIQGTHEIISLPLPPEDEEV